MNVYEVTSISQALLEKFENTRQIGWVHSSFTNSLNCLLDDCLITVADVALGNMPYGMLCDFGGLELRMIVSSGEPVRIQGSSLLLGRKPLKLDFSNSTAWSPTLELAANPAPGFKDRIERVRRRVQMQRRSNGLVPLVFDLDDIQMNQPGRSPFQILLLRRGEEAIRTLLSAIHGGSREEIIRSADGLIGLGIGLTPSGDDVLLGMLATLQRIGPVQQRLLFKNISSEIAKRAMSRTTDISKSQFIAVGQGYVTERFGRFLKTLWSGDEDDQLDECLTNMLAFGSSSGSETVLGMLLAIGLLCELNGALGE